MGNQTNHSDRQRERENKEKMHSSPEHQGESVAGYFLPHPAHPAGKDLCKLDAVLYRDLVLHLSKLCNGLAFAT